jgi:hypothetical protein
MGGRGYYKWIFHRKVVLSTLDELGSSYMSCYEHATNVPLTSLDKG